MDISFNSKNARYSFETVDRVTIEGMPLRLHLDTEVGLVFIREDGSQLARQISHEELGRLGARGLIRVERNFYCTEATKKRLARGDVSLSALVGKPAARMKKRVIYSDAAVELHREGMIKFTDESIVANQQLLMGRVMMLARRTAPLYGNQSLDSENLCVPPSPRTLRRWLSGVQDFGLAGLRDGMDRRGNRHPRMSPEEIGLMMKEVNRYLSMDKPTIKWTHEQVELAFRKVNEERRAQGKSAFEIPSAEKVRRTIRAMDPFRVELARNGAEAARKKFRPVTGGLVVTRPFERIEIDEWTVDTMTLMESHQLYSMITDDERRSIGLYVKGDHIDAVNYKPKIKPKDRWTLTAAICCATRCIVSLVLSFKPNAEAAVQALQMMTANKGQWSDAVGALTPWDMHGTPELIVFDGGPAFKSLRFRMAAEDLGIAWEMGIAGTPEIRGTIERVFQTFALDLAPRLSGRTFSNIVEKGDADPGLRTALNLDDFTFCLLRYVTDIYHNTPNRGLGGEKPIDAWRRLSAKYGVTPPPDDERMRVCFGHQREYRLDKTGVTILGVQYQSEFLASYMRHRAPKSVSVRWHPRNIGEISVLIDKAWVTVPSVDPSKQGVAAQTWLSALRKVKSASPSSNRLDNHAVRAAIHDIQERNAAAMAKAGLNLEDWSDDRFAKAERELLAGVEFYDRKEPTKLADELGHNIPSVEEITGLPATKPAKRGKQTGTSAPGSVPDSSYTIEDN